MAFFPPAPERLASLADCNSCSLLESGSSSSLERIWPWTSAVLSAATFASAAAAAASASAAAAAATASAAASAFAFAD